MTATCCGAALAPCSAPALAENDPSPEEMDAAFATILDAVSTEADAMETVTADIPEPRSFDQLSVAERAKLAGPTSLHESIIAAALSGESDESDAVEDDGGAE